MNWEYKRITVSDFACRDEDHEARLLNELGYGVTHEPT